MEQLTDILKAANLRLTEPRKVVFLALRNSAIPLTASDIVHDCPGVNRTSVYRILETFYRLGIITTLHVGWKPHYELTEPFLPHHHHLICSHCKTADPLQDLELESFIRSLGLKYNFQIAKHHFELEGLCHNCQKLEN